MKLENTYEKSHYVSAAQVSQLSTKLKLPESRIKIWFQNRRAREKKKSRMMSTCQTTSKTCPATASDRKEQQEASEIDVCPTNYNSSTRYNTTHHTFPSSFALQPSNGTYFNNGWCAMLRVPPTCHLSYFDYTLYNRLGVYE